MLVDFFLRFIVSACNYFPFRPGALSFSFSNVQLDKTVLVLDTHHVVPSEKHRHTHREQHDYLLICFLIVLVLRRKKCSKPFCVVLFPSIRVLGACWVYYKMGILKLTTHIGFGFFKLFWAHQCQFFVYKLGPR